MLALENLGTILLAALGISFLIFIHEAGHFVAARLFGVRVEVFSLGFGPRVCGWRRGPTDYRISLVPLGGYVKMAGEYGSSDEDRPPEPDELNAKPPWQRAIIFSGGVLVNFAFAFVAFPLAFSLGVPFTAPILGEIVPGGAAWRAGLRPGDEVLELNGREIYKFDDIGLEVALGGDSGLARVRRGGEVLELPFRADRNVEEGRYEIGAHPAESRRVVVLRPDGPAARAGLATGDRLLSVNGVPLDERSWLSVVEPIVLAAQASEPLQIVYERAGATGTARVEPDLVDAEPARTLLGVLPRATLVTGLRGDAARPGGPIHVGDVLASVQGRPVFTATEVAGALAASSAEAKTPAGGGPAQLTLLRAGEALVVPLGDELRGSLLAGDFAFGNDPGATVRVLPGGALAAAGLRDGDRILSLGTEAVASYADLQGLVGDTPRTWAVRYVSGADGQTRTLTAASVPARLPDYGMGFPPLETIRRESLAGAVQAGWDTSLNALRTTWLTLAKLFTGEVGASNLGGIVQISVITYHIADTSAAYLLFFLALLSINLGFINVLPIPVLDGGQLLFLLFEKIKGSRLSDRFLNAAQLAGLVAILLLVFYVTFNDIRRLVAG